MPRAEASSAERLPTSSSRRTSATTSRARSGSGTTVGCSTRCAGHSDGSISRSPSLGERHPMDELDTLRQLTRPATAAELRCLQVDIERHVDRVDSERVNNEFVDVELARGVAK